jgi:hypothetical protein
MSNDQNVIKYAKHNKVRIKAGIKREEITKPASPLVILFILYKLMNQ